MTISPHDLEPSDDELDPVVDATGQRSWTDLAITGLRIVVWTFAELTFLLGAWGMIGWSLAGWGPVVVTSDSMRPTLDAGDVVLVSADASIGQRDVIVFERGDALIAHRVFAVEDDFFITKGDANASPDTDPVAASDVVGAGRLVIPMVGLPIVWAQTGQWLPFVGWSLLTGAGILGTALAADRAIRRRRDDETDAVVAIARVGVQRVRVLTAVLIGGQLLLGNDDTSLGDGATWLTIGAAAALVATNLLGSTRARAGGNERVTAVIELTIDTTLVVVLALAAGNSLSWILFALPIIEAAVRFRLVGALLHWMALTGGTLAVELWQSADRPSGDTVAALESRLDQLGVLFLFVIPAAYLAEQLLGEVTTWRTATGNAVARGELLARVADVGRDVVRLDGGHLDAIVHGVRSIGFDRADLVMDPGDGRWRVLAGSELPPAGGAASGTRSQDAPSIATIVTPGDPDPAEVGALAEHGLAALVTHVVVDSLNRRIVLRSGIDAGADVTAERIEAFRLLAGQAVVALQNDQLMSEITSMHDELEHRAMHDELTGLPNRALMLRELREATSAWKDSAVLFLDLDGFKPVNDRLGHDIGDVLLRRVAQRLVEQAPEGAVVARLGGDEFTILLTGTDVAQRVSVAERIVASISLPFDIGEQMISISTSIGIAVG
ncbi:MAG: signal peptidase I, partial [Actinomycetota bacterium]